VNGGGSSFFVEIPQEQGSANGHHAQRTTAA
jgi:hypothetical protein